MGYVTIHLTYGKKQAGSQLNLPHGTIVEKKQREKNWKRKALIREDPVRVLIRGRSPGEEGCLGWKGFVDQMLLSRRYYTIKCSTIQWRYEIVHF